MIDIKYNEDAKRKTSSISKLGLHVQKWIRNKDKYGTAPSFNYKGESTYKTLPGGILSMIIMMAFYANVLL